MTYLGQQIIIFQLNLFLTPSNSPERRQTEGEGGEACAFLATDGSVCRETVERLQQCELSKLSPEGFNCSPQTQGRFGATRV